MIKSTAEFSPCRKYRYDLRRVWNTEGEPLRLCHFVMLNPSTADQFQDDPTVSRCQVRARELGFNGLVVSNIFAWRSTDPWALYDLSDPVGPDNDDWIRTSANDSTLTICAWGGHGKLHDRGRQVESMLRICGFKLHNLRLSKITGEPGHPLYIGYSVKPVLWGASR